MLNHWFLARFSACYLLIKIQIERHRMFNHTFRKITSLQVLNLFDRRAEIMRSILEEDMILFTDAYLDTESQKKKASKLAKAFSDSADMVRIEFNLSEAESWEYLRIGSFLAEFRELMNMDEEDKEEYIALVESGSLFDSDEQTYFTKVVDNINEQIAEVVENKEKFQDIISDMKEPSEILEDINNEITVILHCMSKIYRLWDKNFNDIDDLLVQYYPFSRDLLEEMHEVSAWQENISEQINNLREDYDV